MVTTLEIAWFSAD